MGAVITLSGLCEVLRLRPSWIWFTRISEFGTC